MSKSQKDQEPYLALSYQ